MAHLLVPDIITGIWTYRSWRNSDDLTIKPEDLLFGSGYIQIDAAPFNEFRGKIFGPHSDTNPNPKSKPYGWELHLKGSCNYGDPFSFRFQGTGLVDGSLWVYDYQGYMIKPWPNSDIQVPSMVGTIVRTIPHPDTKGGTAPAGVVASWYAVRYNEDK